MLPLKLTVAALLHELRRLGVAVPTAIPQDDMGLPSSGSPPSNSASPLLVLVGDPSSRRTCLLLESLCGVRLGDMLLKQRTSIVLGATPLIVRVVNSEGGEFEESKNYKTTISMSHAGEEILAAESELKEIAAALQQLHLEASKAEPEIIMNSDVGACPHPAITLTIHHRYSGAWGDPASEVHDFTLVIFPSGVEEEKEADILPPPLDDDASFSSIQHDLHDLILPFLRSSSMLLLDMHILSAPQNLPPHLHPRYNWPVDFDFSCSFTVVALVTEVIIMPRRHRSQEEEEEDWGQPQNHLLTRLGVHSKCTMCVSNQLSLPETSLHRLFYLTLGRRLPQLSKKQQFLKLPAALKTSLLIETVSRLSRVQKQKRRDLLTVVIPLETHTAFRRIAASVQRDLVLLRGGQQQQAQHFPLMIHKYTDALHAVSADLRRSLTSSEMVRLPLRLSCLNRMRRLLLDRRPRPVGQNIILGDDDNTRMLIREATAKVVKDLAKRRLLDAWWRDIGVSALSLLHERAIEMVRAVVGKHAEEIWALQKMYDASFDKELAKCKAKCERMIRRLLRKEVKGAIVSGMQKNATGGGTTTYTSTSTTSTLLSVRRRLEKLRRDSGPSVVVADGTCTEVAQAAEDGAVREVAAEAFMNWEFLLRRLAEAVPRELSVFLQNAILNVPTRVATAMLQRQEQETDSNNKKVKLPRDIAEALVEAAGSGAMVEDYRHVRLCKSLLLLLLPKHLPHMSSPYV